MLPKTAPTRPAASTPKAGGHVTALTIGTFDGVHLGHQALVSRAATAARAAATRNGGQARTVVLAFDPNPLAMLAPGKEPARLTTWGQRVRELRKAGADEVVRLEPTRERLSMSAEAFVEWVVKEFQPATIVEGPDFHFGAKRAGDVAILTKLGQSHGFDVDVVEQVEVVLTDHTIAPARSTTVRWMIENGRIGDAACLLGRPYSMAGKVVRGDRRGRTIGFPTANIDSPCLAPADGVYAGRALLPGGRTLAAAISVGTKPTFGTNARAVEAYLMDAAAGPAGRSGQWTAIDGLPEYDWPIEVEFLAFVRDQVKFDSLAALLEQMARDCTRCTEIAASSDSAYRMTA